MIDISTLNPAQLEAVTAPDGPVLVIAGAGSGKTRTIVHRLAWLAEQGVPASDMLLLTFTRKASREMLLRATDLLGYSIGGVHGGTFHSFAFSVLRQYRPAWAEGPVTVMDSADSASAIQQCKERLKVGKGDRSFPKTQTIIGLLSKARNKEISIGDVLQRDAQHLLPHADALESIGEAYRGYRRQHGLLDYDDLLFELEDLLKGDPEAGREGLAERFRERYRYIMVDEYQDTNEVQDCIFQAISREGGNLFTVGDVKQSIYRFRLADPTIFLEKYRRYADAAKAADGQPRRMVLSRNFRSRQEVLTATNFVFGDIMSQEMGEMDYTADEQLYFGADYYAEAADRETEMHVISVEDTPEEKFDRTEAEARFTARRIRQLLDEGFPIQGEGGVMRPVRPDDIVILMRSPRSRMKAFTAALAREGIPCGGGERDDFFGAIEIAVTVSLLEIVDNPRQDVPLISVLRSPLVGLCPDELAAIRALQVEGDYYDALCRDEGPAVREFLALLEELRRAAQEMAVDELLWYIYDRCRVMAIFGAMADGALRQARLTALYDYARQLVQSGKAGLFDFITHLRRLLEKGDAPGLSAARSAEGVQIMSVHGSKGLEFPVVILADLQRSFNQQDMSRPVLVHPTLGLGTERVDMERHIRYKTISKTALALRLEREAKAEEMRILYVAMTRAKEKLILIDCRRHMDKKLRELAVLTGSPVMPEAVAAAKSPGEWLLLSLLHTHEAAPLHALAGIRPETLTPIPEGWTIRLWRGNGGATGDGASVPTERRDTQTYTQPDRAALAFEYPHQAVTTIPTKLTATQLKGRELDQEIAEGAGTVRRPAAPEKPRFLQTARGLSAAERGTAIHLAMQYLPLDTEPTEEAVRSRVRMLEQRRLLTPEQAEAVDAKSIAAFLRSPLAARIQSAEKVWREYRFALLMPAERYAKGAEGEELLLQGVADCVFEEKGALTVVDFKTDRVTAEETLQRAELYRPQLQAYSDALSRIMEKPVSQRILYFFRSGTEISL